MLRKVETPIFNHGGWLVATFQILVQVCLQIFSDKYQLVRPKHQYQSEPTKIITQKNLT